MNNSDFLLLMLAMGAVTYLPRMVPLVTLSQRKLPVWFDEWLELIPPAILSALIAPTLFAHSNPRVFSLSRIELLAALPTLFCAYKTRSLAGTVIVGMLCYWGLGLII
ncbi:MAG: AzlD domain-containing protein [Desulfuromonadales bacterium]